MTTGINGIAIFSGSDFTIDKLTFTRDADDTIDYTDAVVSVEFYDSAAVTTPLLTLTSASGSNFAHITNTDASQVFSLTLTAANLTTLLASRATNVVGYRFLLTPSGARVANPPKGRGYDGKITIQQPSYAGTT